MPVANNAWHSICPFAIDRAHDKRTVKDLVIDMQFSDCRGQSGCQFAEMIVADIEFRQRGAVLHNRGHIAAEGVVREVEFAQLRQLQHAVLHLTTEVVVA